MTSLDAIRTPRHLFKGESQEVTLEHLTDGVLLTKIAEDYTKPFSVPEVIPSSQLLQLSKHAGYVTALYSLFESLQVETNYNTEYFCAIDLLSSAGPSKFPRYVQDITAAVSAIERLHTPKVLSSERSVRNDSTNDITPTEFVQEHGLEEAITISGAILRDVFGPTSVLESSVESDYDSGRQYLVVEARFEFPNADERFQDLIDCDRQLLRRYVQEVSSSHRQHMVFRSVPIA